MVITVNGMKIYYEAAGDGEPVLLLHGWGADASSLRPVLKLVRESLPARAIALDFPGFGFSDHPSEAWDVGRYETFLEDFLAALRLQRVTLIAHSFGGRVAIKFAARCPERIERLVLVDSAGIRPPRTLYWYVRVGLAKIVKYAYRWAPGLAKLLHLERLAARQGSADYRSAGEMRQTFVKVVNEDLRDDLPSIHCPTLLVWGERDESTPLTDAEIMHAVIAGSRLEVLRGAGHFSYADAFPEFSRILIPFLKETL
ncbi:MAG TPA: alpha/beta hydrolase [Anaerolineaceae bacterium]